MSISRGIEYLKAASIVSVFIILYLPWPSTDPQSPFKATGKTQTYIKAVNGSDWKWMNVFLSWPAPRIFFVHSNDFLVIHSNKNIFKGRLQRLSICCLFTFWRYFYFLSKWKNIFKGSLNQNKLFTRKSQNKNKASYYVSLLTGENFFVSQVTWGPIFKFYFKVGFGVQGLLLE